MNYVLESIKSDNDYVFCVVEKATDQIIDSFDFLDDAMDYRDFLNSGGAFDGFTPAFVLTPFYAEEINEEFEEAFA